MAHQEIDLANPKNNRRSAGFTDEERGQLNALLDIWFTDTYRYFQPEQTGPTGGLTALEPANAM